MRSGLVYGLGGPAIGFAALLLWGTINGRLFDGHSHEAPLQVLGGLLLLLPAAYLLGLVPAVLTGLLLGSVLAAGRRRLFLVASPPVGAGLSFLLLPVLAGQQGPWLRAAMQDAPWSIGCGGISSAVCAVAMLGWVKS